MAEAAVILADGVGLEATTMRRLADDLGVTAMALYRHVSDREDLVDAMVDVVVSRLEPAAAAVDVVESSVGSAASAAVVMEPAASAADAMVSRVESAASPVGVTWGAAIRAQILGARAQVLAHPWMVEAIETRTGASPVVLAYMDRLMATMFSGGLSADLVHHAMHALSTRMWGFTRDVFPTPTLPDDPGEHQAALEGFATTYPAIVRMATTAPGAGQACDTDAEFAFALDLMLNAIDALHRTGWTSVHTGHPPARGAP